ncbi:uroporphyrin-III C-methyltransferase [Sorangium cellulosum]|uniref:Uroporphyrin-III C-methyltransferase n=1 Tax=Sorangium cellulosum TaxID=56 RepID=A0A2L0ETA4_SORCE|nr:SAM-dependent methyltransferase [Sorangium cellulosum]AUX42523.1 uroporphyrin-III C-methyltransferase [Sorangium cellulosum]
MDKRGMLLIVGAGIRTDSQLTREAEKAIVAADKVLFAAQDPWAVRVIRALRADAESLSYPHDGRPRRQIYEEMVERIVVEVLQGQKVCAVFYGHPGVLADAPHEAIRRVAGAGLVARMCPGVSFLDCLFADLGVDPVRQGCTVLEASDFLFRPRRLDPRVSLVLSQISQIGNSGVFDAEDHDRITRGLSLLSEVLCESWPGDHEAILYEASFMPGTPPRREPVAVRDLGSAAVSEVSSLWVPALPPPAVDRRRAARLGWPGAGRTAA